MGQTEIVVHLIQYKLLQQPLLALTQRADPSSDRGHMLADAQVHALNERGVDLPAAGRYHLLHRLERPEHHTVAHSYQVPPAHGLDDLRVEQLRQWHPARFRHRATGSAAWWLDPLAKVRQ